MSHYKNRSRFLLKLLFLISIALILPNCASKQPSKTTWADQSNPLLQQAQEALSAQQFSNAAQLFVQLAKASHLPLKNQYLIAAADAYIKANTPINANDLINTLLSRASQLTPSNKLAISTILLKQGKVDDANKLLMSLDQSRLTVEQRLNLHTLSSSAFFQAGNLIESARERILLDTLLIQQKEKLNNQTKLVETLSLLSQQALGFLRPTADNNMAGWIDLALILKQQATLNPDSIEVNRWKELHPAHTANKGFLTTIAEQALMNFNTPNKVGVFLPTQGPFSKAAYSIKKGITASAYAMANRWPVNIQFYDTSSAPIETLYQQSIDDGINVILGPLEKSNAAKMATINTLSIPVIALNKNGIHHSDNYYEFSLSPEEDVTQVLSLAWLKGHEKALILTPQSRYGERLARHFSTIWQQLGGEILGVQTYTLKQADYSAPIKNLLQLDESLSRFRQLRQRLNLSIQFEERRRHDADFIFLVAAPREGRLIKPQLRFHRASNVPVFSTSKIYEGELNKVANRDLDGTFFCDMAWFIEPKNNVDINLDNALKLWPNTRGLHRRLMAFGYDAHQLIPHLERLKSNDFSRFRGKTGILSMNHNGQINRQLSCGRFKRGSITSLGLAPHLERALNMPPSYSSEQAIDENTSPL
ncbi:MAG: LppC family lipoprotein [Cycloclasticus sp. symbiont of Bathymodiolus heckerae]|nr:MAG: LppC family lipoprotein [Cycloclasticus sp. symbiont of Bathymodiolus heckerae]